LAKKSSKVTAAQEAQATETTTEEMATEAESAPVNETRRPFQGGFEFEVTEEEKAAMADEAAGLDGEIINLERVLKGSKESLGGQIKAKKKELSDIYDALRSGTRNKIVDCEEILDFENDEVRYELNGEVLRRRPMEEQERQLAMKTDVPDDAMAQHSTDEDNHTENQMTFAEQRAALDDRIAANEERVT
jgi:predicted HicB family RNase H-like nuclease